MACMISISDKNEEMWMIKNSIYNEFITLICNRVDKMDKRIENELIKSIYTNGVALDKLDDKSFAKVLSTVIKETAALLYNGDLILASMKNLEPKKWDEIKGLFKNLYSILSKWEINDNKS